MDTRAGVTNPRPRANVLRSILVNLDNGDFSFRSLENFHSFKRFKTKARAGGFSISRRGMAANGGQTIGSVAAATRETGRTAPSVDLRDNDQEMSVVPLQLRKWLLEAIRLTGKLRSIVP